MACGSTKRDTVGMCISSTSSAASGASERMSAVVIPGVILSPFVLEATWPIEKSAARSRRVVVDFPLVPETTTLRRFFANSASKFGSSFSATLPPIIPPEPRPRRREAQLAPFPAATATRQFCEQIRVKLQRYFATDHPTRTASEATRGPAGTLPRCYCYART